MKLLPVKINEGRDVHEELKNIIKSNGLNGGFITGIGGLREAIIGFYNMAEDRYLEEHLQPENTVIEVASLQGNYLVREGKVSVHLHVVAGLQGRTVAGHLIRGVAKPFLEVFLVEVGEAVGEVFTHRS
ncbi:MAG: DNA-binding protein [Desulfurococcus sp.]|nr:DNA-binding protein [Desulfurococcus sp.]